MADEAQVLGAGELLEALGETWTVLPRLLSVEGEYIRWLKVSDRQECFGMKPFISPDSFRVWMSELDARDYKWGGEYWRARISTDDGSLYLFYLLLRQKHPTADLAKARAICEDQPEMAAWVYSAVMRQSDPLLFSPPKERPATGKKETAATPETETPSPSPT